MKDNADIATLIQSEVVKWDNGEIEFNELGKQVKAILDAQPPPVDADDTLDGIVDELFKEIGYYNDSDGFRHPADPKPEKSEDEVMKDHIRQACRDYAAKQGELLGECEEFILGASSDTFGRHERRKALLGKLDNIKKARE